MESSTTHNFLEAWNGKWEKVKSKKWEDKERGEKERQGNDKKTEQGISLIEKNSKNNWWDMEDKKLKKTRRKLNKEFPSGWSKKVQSKQIHNKFPPSEKK